MNKEGTIYTGDFLNIDSFDPMKVDVTYIQSTIKEIPEDGVIDINQAEQLATKFLRCADFCGDLVAKSQRYMGYNETKRRAAKSSAIYSKIKEHVTPTVAKEAFADKDEYIQVANEATTADALLRWLEEKYQNLIRAHILCKNILQRQTSGEHSNSWRGGERNEDYTLVNNAKLLTKETKKKRVGEIEEFEL